MEPNYQEKQVRNSTELKKRMEGRWLNAFRALAPSLNTAVDKLGRNVPCPVYGGTDGFRLFKDANETGGGVKHALRVFPEGIDLLMWVNGWNFSKTYDELEAYLGEKSISTGRTTRNRERTEAPPNEGKLKDWLNRIWLEAVLLSDADANPARLYFHSREIYVAAMSAADIRFHPSLNYSDEDGSSWGKYGAVVCLVRNNEGHPVALHRTYITKSGSKLNLGKRQKAKKLTPSLHQRCKGRQIRLFEPRGGVVGVSEGLETALAVFQAKQFPVWPGLSTTMLASFVPPRGVHTVINFVDKDRNGAGQKAAEILRANLAQEGIRVIDLLPPCPILDSDPKGVDWADQLKRDISGFDLLDRALRK